MAFLTSFLDMTLMILDSCRVSLLAFRGRRSSAVHDYLDEAKVLGHFLLGLLGPVLFFFAITPVVILVRYLQILFILFLIFFPVLNLESGLFLIHIVVWDCAEISGIMRK